MCSAILFIAAGGLPDKSPTECYCELRLANISRTPTDERRKKLGMRNDTKSIVFDTTVTFGGSMSIEELLQQMEEYHNRREQRDHRPAWLKRFVNTAAAVFEPLTDIGRVGFDCNADEQGWLVCMYLGTTEIIGGPRDGQIDHAGFKIDVLQVHSLFCSVERFEWFSVANEKDDRFSQNVRSVMVVHGTLEDGQSVRLELLHVPPKYVSAGISQKYNYGDGDTFHLN